MITEYRNFILTDQTAAYDTRGEAFDALMYRRSEPPCYVIIDKSVIPQDSDRFIKQEIDTYID